MTGSSPVVRAGALVRRWYRPAVVALAGIASAAVVLAVGVTGPGDGLLFDLTVVARARFAPATDDPAGSPVAIVAIDQGSLDTDELRDRPRALMAPEWARILDGLFAAGARAVGFDVIFAYSGNQLVAEMDAPLLEALDRHRARVVLARSESTIPYIAYVGAVGAIEDPERLGLASLDPDRDGVFRRVRSRVPTGEPTLTSLVLGRVGVDMPETVLLAPRRHYEAIPTYAMADVLRCARADPAAVAAAFRDKVVMVGGTHPDEDRKTSSARWLRPSVLAGAPLASCGLHRLAASAPASDTVPGVAIHAGAIEAVLSRRVTSTAPTLFVAGLAGNAAMAGAVAGLMLPPWLTVVAVVVAALLLFTLATAVLGAGLAVPLSLPLLGLVVAPWVAYVARYLVEERRRRSIADAFTRFAPRELVERLADDPASLRLGGEERDVTVIFADLAGFTALSTHVPPTELMQAVNHHLTAVADAVEDAGGYVDKFIGDAVMGLFGAPVPLPSHAGAAVLASIAAERAVVEASATSPGGAKLSVKIGVNSGRAVVGLVGTPRRYNYTAVGEVVNVASRLEGVPALYGCRIVIGEATARLLGDGFLLRELDRLLVKGAADPIRIYEPIAERATATPAQQSAVAGFTEALALYRARRFDEAAKRWDELAALEPAAPAHDGHDHPANPPHAMARRARELLATPPPPDWNAVTVLTTK